MHKKKISVSFFMTAIFLYLLLFVSVFKSADDNTLNQFILWVIGPVTAFVVVLEYSQYPFKLPTEFWMYFIFFVLCFLGLYVVVDQMAFYRYLKLIFSNVVLMFMLVCAVYWTRNVKHLFIMFFLVSLSIFIGYIINGAALIDISVEQGERVTGGILVNANGFANVMRNGILISFILLQLVEQKVYRSILKGSIFLFAFGVLASGSRGPFINVLVIFFFAFLILGKPKNVRSIILLGAILMAAFFFFEDVLPNTLVFERFQEREVTEDIRYELLIQGFNIFLDNPVLGIGLNQYSFSGGRYFHNDAIDVLATTGLVSFSFYFFMYVILWRRLYKVNKFYSKHKDVKLLKLLKFFQLAFFSSILYGFTNPNFLTIVEIIMLSLILGFVYVLDVSRHNYKLKLTP